MENIALGAQTVLNTLRGAGYEAYLVGGCVRDLLLGRPVHDWDIATSALPEETMRVFLRCVPTGLKHGTITVLVKGDGYEVTTFRTDGDYRDGRHPENVTFVRSLSEDLSRRDFTVNAMAMDGAGNITDLFGGRDDLAAKCIRCVGDPALRFSEDALRMLRALRFSAQLGFAVEGRTYAAIRRCAPLCAGLSAERVRDEVEKTLLSDDPQAVSEMIRLKLLGELGLAGSPNLLPLSALPRERDVRWAGFFRAVPQANWQDFRLDRKTGETASKAAALADFPRDRVGLKMLCAAHGLSVARCTAALAGTGEILREIEDSGECVSLAQLCVSGRDFPELSGAALGQHLHALLDYVILHPQDNRREILLTLHPKV